jgi:beta-glucosidase
MYYQFRQHHGTYKDIPWLPAWSFGNGLGYSHIAYLNVTSDRNVYRLGDDVRLTIFIRNDGKYDQDEIVPVWLCIDVVSVTWVYSQLKGFKRQTIKVGETISVEIAIPVSDIWIINAKGEQVVEPGDYVLEVAGLQRPIIIE